MLASAGRQWLRVRVLLQCRFEAPAALRWRLPRVVLPLLLLLMTALLQLLLILV